MNESLENIFDGIPEEDICVKSFTEFLPYCQEWLIEHIFVKKVRVCKTLEEIKKNPLNQEYIFLIEKYIQCKEHSIPFPKEYDIRLLELLTTIAPGLSYETLNKDRKKYRAMMKLADVIRTKMREGEIDIIDTEQESASEFIEKTIEALNKFIEITITTLKEPWKVTSEVENNRAELSCYLAIAEADPILVKYYQQYREEIGEGKGLIGFIDTRSSRETEELKEEAVRTLERIPFEEVEKQEWRKVIEKMKQRTMEDELKNILQLFRSIESGLQESSEKIEELEGGLVVSATECEENIVNFGKKMRIKVENAGKRNDEDKARMLLERLKKM